MSGPALRENLIAQAVGALTNEQVPARRWFPVD